jgi:hypothetical protein
MNDFQIYLIARQRIDELQAEALVPRPAPELRLADSLRALAAWFGSAVQIRVPASFPRAYSDVTTA